MSKDNTSFYAVLGILDAGAGSGYDIKKAIEYEIGFYYKISNGQIYPTLGILASKGYATVDIEKNEGKPDRKVYSITETGREIFREWLLRPVNYHNPGGNELLLKLHFGASAGAEHNMTLLADHMGIKKRELGRFNEIASYLNIKTAVTQQEIYSYIALLYGQTLAEANIAWCGEAMKILKAMEGKAGSND